MNRILGHIRLVVCVTGVALLVACTRVPDNVIAPDRMADLLADLHTAESVVELNFGEYAADSTRKALKQAVLKRHEVTQQQLDTSFVWYGAHLDKYMDVYDDVAEILQQRLDRNDALQSEQASLSISGDSVDVWTSPRQMLISPRRPSEFITFQIKADANSQPGDSYAWRAKLFNYQPRSRWGITAHYTDGSFEVLDNPVSGEGWHTMTFHTDSTRTLSQLQGYMRLTLPTNQSAVYVDSIELVRRRLDPQMYVQRYRQRRYDLNPAN